VDKEVNNFYTKPIIIVEGKNDRVRIRELLGDEEITILCTYGTPGTERLEQLKAQVHDRQVYIFTDNDRSGAKIRAVLRDAFPDAEHIYTHKGYAGVEGTPNEYLLERLEKAGLMDKIE
jgi:toprim domain protein